MPLKELHEPVRFHSNGTATRFHLSGSRSSSPLKNHLVQGSRAEMPMPSGFQAQERQQAQHDHHHARDTA
jgi:hypothetical protein